MRGLYCQSNKSFLDLLRPIFGHLDSLYWIVDCQMGPVNSGWVHESEENEHIYDGLFISVPAFAPYGSCLWRPGSLSLIGHALYFDEWSHFVGFNSIETEAVARATRIGPPSETSKFYETLKREGGELHVIQADGWWEFYFAREELFSRIQAMTSWREIAPGLGNSWEPRFL